MTRLNDEQWNDREVALFNGAVIVFAVAIVISPFLIPEELIYSWPPAIAIYDRLAAIFPFLSTSLSLSGDPEFYIVSKLILFSLGTLYILLCLFFPLTREIHIESYQTILDARKALWWFWLLFVVVGYGCFFWMYSRETNLSWASKAAIASRPGIAIGNLAHFSVFVLLALYLLLVKQYFRLRSAWRIEHDKTQPK